MILCLVGNKSDVNDNERKITKSQGKKLDDDNNMQFYESSAKTSKGNKNLFKKVSRKAYEQLKKQ